jgi:hypothetical protein
LIGSSFLACSSSLFSVSHSIFNREAGDILCASLLPVQNLWNLRDWFPHTLLKVCSTHKDKVAIKCMGSVGEKTPTEPKLYLFFSNLRYIELC